MIDGRSTTGRQGDVELFLGGSDPEGNALNRDCTGEWVHAGGAS